MATFDLLSDSQCDLALTTPEIFKMLDLPDFQSPAIQTGDNPEMQYSGLMGDYESEMIRIVSPNSACYGIDNTVQQHQPQQQHQQQQQHHHQQQQQVGAQQFVPYHIDNGYCSSSNASFPASPEMLASYETMTLNNFNMQDTCAASPADSHLSTDSGASFYNLDQPIKMEPQDSSFPSMIDELNGAQTLVPQQQQQQSMIPVLQYSTVQYTAQQQQPQQQQQQSQQYQTMEQASFAYTESYMPTTVSNMQPTTQVMMQQQQLQPAQLGHQSITVSMPSTSAAVAGPSMSLGSSVHVPNTPSAAGRKRGANGAFASTSGDQNVSSASKKQRMTKRQKQQMMDKQVEEYTHKNKDLKQQIELLERKVQFCTQFLQKYVSPIVQGRQNTFNAVSVGAL